MTTSRIPNSFLRSPMAQAVGALYRTGGNLRQFILGHIDDLKASDGDSVSATGRVLDEALHGLRLGFAAPVVIIVVGQLMLGNPLGAFTSGAAMAFSPVAMTCAAVGAIYMGWRALSAKDRDKLLQTASDGLSIATDVLTRVVEFMLQVAQTVFSNSQLSALRRIVVGEAAAFGTSLGRITGRILDHATDMLPHKPPTPRGGDDALTEVLAAMNRGEIVALLKKTLHWTGNPKGVRVAGLRKQALEAIGDAASYSWPWASRPTYPEVVAMVARQLKLPSPESVDVREVERLILFKLIETSLGKLDDKERAALVSNVERQLHERGVSGQVTFDEIFKFVKTGTIDVGSTLGGLVFSAPGMYGVIGLDFLQFVILKGIVLTSGYFAASTALLGFGAGGLMLTIAGWVGPIGAGLALLYGAYSVSGPAYRKIVPAVCLIAAKRLEMTQSH